MPAVAAAIIVVDPTTPRCVLEPLPPVILIKLALERTELPELLASTEELLLPFPFPLLWSN